MKNDKKINTKRHSKEINTTTTKHQKRTQCASYKYIQYASSIKRSIRNTIEAGENGVWLQVSLNAGLGWLAACRLGLHSKTLGYRTRVVVHDPVLRRLSRGQQRSSRAAGTRDEIVARTGGRRRSYSSL